MSPNLPVVPFGKHFREEYFTLIEHGVTPVNHGSYGLTPTPVFNKFLDNVRDENKFPDEFIKLRQKKEYLQSLKILGKEMLGCDYHNLALVDNATSGVNIVLRLLRFKKGDKIVMPSTVYENCGKTVRFLQDYVGIEPVTVDIKYPLENEEIIQKFEQAFRQLQVKVCLFDTIISVPGVRFPFEALTQLCKKHKVLSLIDGAHSIGILPMNLGELQPDFYVSNLHKWLYVPRGCAVMYVDSKHFGSILTMPIGNSYIPAGEELPYAPEMELIEKFQYISSRLFAQISCIEGAIHFRQNACGGEATINRYCNELCQTVGRFISLEKWPELSVLSVDTVTTMINIEVPVVHLAKRAGLILTNDLLRMFLPAWKPSIESEMLKHRTFVPLFYHNGRIYARFSCQIYNELDDYDYASDVVVKVLTGLFASEKARTWVDENGDQSTG